jgi:hypothetical protein
MAPCNMVPQQIFSLLALIKRGEKPLTSPNSVVHYTDDDISSRANVEIYRNFR